jgi:hypothetical protein
LRNPPFGGFQKKRAIKNSPGIERNLTLHSAFCYATLRKGGNHGARSASYDPGKFIRAEIIEPLELSGTRATELLGVTRPALSALLNCGVAL